MNLLRYSLFFLLCVVNQVKSISVLCQTKKQPRLVLRPLFNGFGLIRASGAFLLGIVLDVDSGFLIKTGRDSANTAMTDNKREASFCFDHLIPRVLQNFDVIHNHHE